MCRDFALTHLTQHVKPADEGVLLPPELRLKLGELGAIGLPLPEEYGGGGGSHLAWAVLHEELSRVLPAVSMYFQTNTLVAAAILHAGTEDQIRAWVPDLLSGKLSSFLAFTEPQTGTDTRMMTTRATRTDNGWRIRGTKMWISNARSSDIGIVFAKDPDDDISLFLVPTDLPGYEPGVQIPIIGARGTELTDLVLDVELPYEYVLGGKTGGQFATLKNVMPMGKIGICASSVGLMQTCLEEAVTYARNREQQGHPIIEFQAIHRLIADMVAAIEASRQITYWAASCKDVWGAAGTELATAKLFVTNKALEVARMAVSVHGVYGIAQGATVERLFRDAQVYELIEGTSEVHRELVIRAVHGIG